jgi:uncharacterized coiled-coil DUF342 family protein
MASKSAKQLENKSDPWAEWAQGVSDQLTALELRLEEHTRKLDELDKRVLELGKQWREVELEWADYFEKFRNLYARASRRLERAEQVQETPAPAPFNPAALALLQRIHGGQK